MTGPNPTDRGKLGTKRHVLTDGQGIPLSVVITAANTHDMKAAISVLDNIVVKRPSSKINKEKQNLCLDKGYDFQEIENGVIKKGYLPHIRHRGEQSITNDVIIIILEEDGLLKEPTPGITGSENFWLDMKRRLENYFALVCLGCCILIYRRIILG